MLALGLTARLCLLQCRHFSDWVGHQTDLYTAVQTSYHLFCAYIVATSPLRRWNLCSNCQQAPSALACLPRDIRPHFRPKRCLTSEHLSQNGLSRRKEVRCCRTSVPGQLSGPRSSKIISNRAPIIICGRHVGSIHSQQRCCSTSQGRI